MSGTLDGRCVLVGVTGGIAAYKSCEIVRLLQKQGARVKVIMSEHATHFVNPTTFRALTHEPVAVGLFDDPSDPIHHISLAQEADCVVVAPATSNIIAKMSCGIADDLISTTLLATTAPIFLAPAMNVHMWRADATQRNIDVLRARGVRIVGPGSGYLACGEVDTGRLADPEDIVQAVVDSFIESDLLSGEHVLITAGSTHEPIDPVRFLGNRSSGRMGVALARAAHAFGAEVTLIMGPSTVEAPHSARVVSVETAAQMLDATLEALPDATMVICAAAVADYTPAHPADHKLKKGIETLDSIELTRTADILATVSAQKENRKVIGFAAETGNPVSYACDKLARKGCTAIVANDVSRADSGFGADTDKAWWITRDEVTEFPVLTKDELARQILIKVQELVG